MDAQEREGRITEALEWISGVLTNLGISFQVVGGLAAIAHGSTRPLHDIDLYVPDGALERLAPRVKQFHRYGPLRQQSEQWDCWMMEVNYAGEDIEIAESGRSRFRSGADARWCEVEVDFEGSERLPAFGVDLPVMPKSELVRYKRVLGREVDHEDLAQISGGA